MIVVGLTGGIGVGKSTVASMLAERGAEVIDVDSLGHVVLEPSGRAYPKVIERFGAGIVADDSTIDRPSLGAIVFADPAALRDLEAISHPAINAEIADRLDAASPGTVVVLDMAILVESQLGKLDDGRGYQQVIVVEAPLEVRLERLERDRDMPPEEAKRRMANQASDDERRAVADHIVDNGGDLDALAGQINDLWPKLDAAARAR